MLSIEQTSPSGGGAVGRRGAFPSGEARLFGFPAARRKRLFPQKGAERSPEEHRKILG